MFFMKFIDFLLKKYQIKKKTQKTLLRFFFAFKMQLKKKGASLFRYFTYLFHFLNYGFVNFLLSEWIQYQCPA